MRKEIALTRLGIAVTLAASTMVASQLIAVLVEQLHDGRLAGAAAHLVFSIIVAFLVYGGLVYQFTRLAHLQRLRGHRPAPRAALDALFDGDAPSLTVLVPSYREEPDVVLKTLLSAALQEYPTRRVVLLIDDPPHPDDLQSARQLADARALPAQVRDMLDGPATRFAAEHRAFVTRRTARRLQPALELERLAVLWVEAAQWFDDCIERCVGTTHVDRLFSARILAPRRDRLLARAQELRLLHSGSELAMLEVTLAREYRKLAALFAVEITSFERKRYENLSHEPNKAMNLNAYIGLMGGAFHTRSSEHGVRLEPTSPALADLNVPDSDYVITLDADSLIAPDYALRLIQLAERPGNGRLAVVQTPYSAFPGAPGMLERIAGATTDIQYLIHQGFTRYDATYWVGANALLRKAALEDIATTVEERGHTVPVFIQDRTVIEDTESTVDLIDRGWRLHNYPQRLAYSATPPDFGSLIIQRRRWANGGLIILPKLIRYLARGPATLSKLGETLMRAHYLVSITAVNFGLLILLAVPFTESVTTFWLPLTAVPYFALYARDLSQIGYRAADIFRVYALNLLLIPVNIGGVCKSLQQAWTRRKIPFGRTPKVHGRTAAGALYVSAEYLLVAHWSVQGIVDLSGELYFHAVFAFVNAAFLMYAIAVFVGLRESWEDVSQGWRAAPRAPTRQPRDHGPSPRDSAAPAASTASAPQPARHRDAPRAGSQ